MHQDVLSSLFDSYDGAPLWLAKKLPPSKHAYPWPMKTPPSSANWATGYVNTVSGRTPVSGMIFCRYLTEAAGKAFQGIYDNAAQATVELATFWQKIAEGVRGNERWNVLGYELINEPWAGDIYSNPLLLLPGLSCPFRCCIYPVPLRRQGW